MYKCNKCSDFTTIKIDINNNVINIENKHYLKKTHSIIPILCQNCPEDSFGDSSEDGSEDGLEDSLEDGLENGLVDDLKDGLEDGFWDSSEDGLGDSSEDGLGDGLEDSSGKGGPIKQSIQPLRHHLTWNMCLTDNSIGSLEHPLFGTAFAKNSFGEMFSPVVRLLDGTTESDYISFFFIRDCMNSSNLVFCDNDAREDFLEWIQEEGCVPTWKEVTQGEDNADKVARDKEERVARLLKIEQDRVAKETSKKTLALKIANRDPLAALISRIVSTFTSLPKLKNKSQTSPSAKVKLSKMTNTLCQLLDDYRIQNTDQIDRLPELLQKDNKEVYHISGCNEDFIR